MPTPLHETKIYRELKRRSVSSNSAKRFCGQVDSSIDQITTYLAEIRRYFHHYTDHCVNHSVRIIDSIGNILQPEQIKRLNATELYLILASALVHDIGLVVGENEVRGLIADPKFLADRKEILERLGYPESGDWTFNGVERMVVAEYVRRAHGRRIVFTLNENLHFCRQLTNGEHDLIKWLGRICLGHTLTFSEVCSLDQFPQCVVIGTDKVNIQFLTFCLRIGDLLDINTARANPVLRELSEPLEALSANHWSQYADIEIRNLAPNSFITIAGTCPSQDAERVLREWCSWLSEECEGAVLTLNTSQSHYALQLGRIAYQVSPKKDNAGIPLYEFHNYRFNLDEEQVFRRLFGKRLFGRPDAALRELLQNSIDAIRVRVAIECSRDGEWGGLNQDQRRQCYEAALAARSKTLSIRIYIEKKDNVLSGKQETWLRIRDCGVGMTREVIEKFLLKVGRSRWAEDPVIKQLNIRMIGEFGIGFLSVFMISERTIIETQSFLPNESGIRATVYSWKGYLATEPITLAEAGTEISLLLKPEARELAENIEEHVDHWCPFGEVPIEVTNSFGKLRMFSVVRPQKHNTRHHQDIFEFGDGSIAAIATKPFTHSTERAPSIAQDGISVPDVPPPLLDESSHSVLREYGIRVDLRGKNRVPLDLSRNLVEGGAHDIWRSIVPQIWQGLVKQGLGFSSAKKALAKYHQTHFEGSTGKDAFVIEPEKGLIVCDLKSIPQLASLGFRDTSDQLLQLCLQDKTEGTILLPVPPESLYYDPEKMDEIEVNRRKAKYWRLKATENDFHERLLDNSADGWNFEYEPLSVRVLDYYLDGLVDKYRYACESLNSYTQLHMVPFSGSVALQDLGIWRMSRMWYAILHPYTRKWVAIFSTDIEQVFSDVDSKVINTLTYEEFVLTLLYGLWPTVDEWKSWSFAGTDFMEKLIQLIEEDAEDSENLSNDEPEDEDIYDLIEKDEELEMESDQYEEKFSNEDFETTKIGASQSAGRLTRFIVNVLPRLPTKTITPSVAPWDAKAWRKKNDRPV